MRDYRDGAVVHFDTLAKMFVHGYKSRGDSGYYCNVAASWVGYFRKADVTIIDVTRVGQVPISLEAK